MRYQRHDMATNKPDRVQLSGNHKYLTIEKKYELLTKICQDYLHPKDRVAILLITDQC